MRLTAEEIYDRLGNDDKILTKKKDASPLH